MIGCPSSLLRSCVLQKGMNSTLFDGRQRAIAAAVRRRRWPP
jgi:hypothetical protein